MKSNNPLSIDGKTYDRFAMNLAVSTKYNADGTPSATVSMLLRPCRIENGSVEVVEDFDRQQTVLLGSLAGMDEATATAVGKVTAAIQEFLDAKGL